MDVVIGIKKEIKKSLTDLSSKVNTLQKETLTDLSSKVILLQNDLSELKRKCKGNKLCNVLVNCSVRIS